MNGIRLHKNWICIYILPEFQVNIIPAIAWKLKPRKEKFCRSTGWPDELQVQTMDSEEKNRKSFQKA